LALAANLAPSKIIGQNKHDIGWFRSGNRSGGSSAQGCKQQGGKYHDDTHDTAQNPISTDL